MKVSEIKELLKGYTEKEKDRIIIELYNKIPKKMREAKGVDEYLKNANAKKEAQNGTFNDDLIAEMNYFISCANEGLYASPNRFISKEDRKNWRYKVKRYYKILKNVPPVGEEGIIATDYLIMLFNLLSYGTHYLTFTSWSTFSSIGIYQLDYLNLLYDRILANGINDETLTKCAKLSLIYCDGNVLYSDGIVDLCYHINNKDDKIKLIDILNKEIEELSKKKRRDSHMIESYYNGLLYFYFTSQKFADGVANFLKNSTDRLEVKLYIILSVLETLEYKEEWIELYEKYENKVEFRDYLKETYLNMKKDIDN